MENKKSYLAWALQLIVAALFILSAFAKLSKGHLLDSPYFAISTFEVKQLYPIGFSEHLAPYFSRTLIGIELALGLLLLQKNGLRKLIIPVTILLLTVFIGHLTYVTFISGGNSGNCGCFGELIPMTPIQAIIKNILAILLLVCLYFIVPKQPKAENFWILTTVLFASILSIYMLAPIQPIATYTVTPFSEKNEIMNDPTKDTLNLEKVTENTQAPDTQKKESINPIEPKKRHSGFAPFFASIDNDKKLLCFFVPGCDHCRAVAKELTDLRKKEASLPPLFILFMDEETFKIPEFFDEIGTKYPYKVVDIINFWKILGQGKDTPGVKYLWNGNEMKMYYGIGDKKFNANDINIQLHKSFSDWKKINPKL